MSRGHFVGAGYHRRLLADSTRVDAYEAAIVELVKPGMVVADIGTGTGLLAFIASKAGARRVFAIDPAPTVRVAREVARHNEVTNVEFFEGDARRIDLPEPVDLIVTECMGNFVVTDEMLDVLADARRHLGPGGRICPSLIRMFLAPVRLPAFQEISFWRDIPVADIDFRAMAEPALRRAYVLQVYEEDVMGEAASFGVIDPMTMTYQDTLENTVELRITTDGLVDGVAGWFDAELSPNVTLSTGPGVRTHWAQLVFPLDGIRAVAGDLLRFSLRLLVDAEQGRSSWRWRAVLVREGLEVARYSADTDSPWGEPLPAHIRPGHDADSAGVIGLVGRVFAEYPGCVLDVDAEEPELRAPASSFDRCWVVEQAGHIVGCVMTTPRGDDHPSGAHLELKKLYLDPSVRGQGLARRLVALVEERTKELGLHRVELWTDTRFENAHGLYAHLGYRRTDRTRELHDLSDTVEYHFVKEL